MRKSEEPLVVHLMNIRRLRLFGHIARSSSREDHHLALAAAIRQVPPDWKRPVGRPSHTVPCSWGRPWPSEFWPRDCLEKGHYSRWMATYCEHSNASVVYALKEERPVRWFSPKPCTECRSRPQLLSQRWLALEVRAPLNPILVTCHRFKSTCACRGINLWIYA